MVSFLKYFLNWIFLAFLIRLLVHMKQCVCSHRGNKNTRLKTVFCSTVSKVLDEPKNRLGAQLLCFPHHFFSCRFWCPVTDNSRYHLTDDSRRHGTDGSDGRDIWHQYSHHSQPMALCHRAFYVLFFNLYASQHIVVCLGLRRRCGGPSVKTGRGGWAEGSFGYVQLFLYYNLPSKFIWLSFCFHQVALEYIDLC